MAVMQSMRSALKRRLSKSMTFLFALGFLVAMVSSVGAAIFEENFEGTWTGAPNSWSTAYASGATDWVRADSGFYDGFVEPIPIAPRPGSGSYFARFSIEEYKTPAPATLLITPKIDFTGYDGAALTFWHTQAEYAGDQDNLRVLYRTSSVSPWIQLVDYNNENIPTWTERTIVLPNLSSDYYLAFEGTARFAFGVCLDDVVISSYSPIPEPSSWVGVLVSLIAYLRVKQYRRGLG